MSDIYTFPGLTKSYGLTTDQWFDPKWNFMDPWKLKYFYRGRRVNLIRGEGHLPERVEVHTRQGENNKMILWKHVVDKLTVSEENLLHWMSVYGKADRRISPINTFGQGVLSSWAAEFSMSGPRRLLFHIANVQNEIAAQENPAAPVNEAGNATIFEKVTTVAAGIFRLVR